jgi:hypothetical protein
MRRVIVRRPSPPVFAIAAGLALGAALGVLLGEVAGPAAARALKRERRPVTRRGSAAELVERAQAVLDDDLPLRECHLHVVPVGRSGIELHGWVPDRRARTRAARLVADAVDTAVTNCVRVAGEDDDMSDADERLA